MQQVLWLDHVQQVRRRGGQRVHQTRFHFHANVRLHSEVPPVALVRLVSLRVAGLPLVLGRGRHLDDGCINDRAFEGNVMICFDRTDLPEPRGNRPGIVRAESEEIGVARWTMRRVEPEGQQQRTLEQELLRMRRDRQPRHQALQTIAGHDLVEVPLRGVGMVLQARPD